MNRSDYLLRKVWMQMFRRCYSPEDQRYHRYGGRGIKVCAAWLRFEAFRDWAYSNGYAEGLSIDREDNDGDYCPENCRWTTPKEQANNTERNHVLEWNDETHTLAEWSEITGIPQTTIWKRVKLGWTPEKTLTKGVRKTLLEYKGETRTLAEWSRITGLADNTISRRLQRGWSIEDALTKNSQRGIKQ